MQFDTAKPLKNFLSIMLKSLTALTFFVLLGAMVANGEVTDCDPLLMRPTHSTSGNPNRVGVSWYLHPDMQAGFEQHNKMLLSPSYPHLGLSHLYALDLTHPLRAGLKSFDGSPVPSSFTETLTDALSDLKDAAKPELFVYLASHGTAEGCLAYGCMEGNGYAVQQLNEVIFKAVDIFAKKNDKPITLNLTYSACYSGKFISSVQQEVSARGAKSPIKVNVLTSSGNEPCNRSMFEQDIHQAEEMIRRSESLGLKLCNDCTDFQLLSKVINEFYWASNFARPGLSTPRSSRRQNSPMAWSSQADLSKWSVEDRLAAIATMAQMILDPKPVRAMDDDISQNVYLREIGRLPEFGFTPHELNLIIAFLKMQKTLPLDYTPQKPVYSAIIKCIEKLQAQLPETGKLG